MYSDSLTGKICQLENFWHAYCEQACCRRKHTNSDAMECYYLLIDYCIRLTSLSNIYCMGLLIIFIKQFQLKFMFHLYTIISRIQNTEHTHCIRTFHYRSSFAQGWWRCIYHSSALIKLQLYKFLSRMDEIDEFERVVKLS